MKKSTNFSMRSVPSVKGKQTPSMKSDLEVVEGVVCSCIIGQQYVTLVTQNITSMEQASLWLKSGKALGMTISLN